LTKLNIYINSFFSLFHDKSVKCGVYLEKDRQKCSSSIVMALLSILVHEYIYECHTFKKIKIFYG